MCNITFYQVKGNNLHRQNPRHYMWQCNLLSNKIKNPVPANHSCSRKNNLHEFNNKPDNANSKNCRQEQLAGVAAAYVTFFH